MGRALRILMLEDAPADAGVVERELRKEGIEFTSLCVEAEAAFRDALMSFRPDLILSGYKLRSIDGFTALEIKNAESPDVPMIFVSDMIGEELAIEALKRGATDYVFKKRLSRLVPVVNRALRDVKERIARRQAEHALRESEQQFRSTFELAAVGIAHVGLDGRFLRINQRYCDILGYTREEMLAKTFQEMTFPDDVENGLGGARQLQEGVIHSNSREKRVIRKDGSLVWVNVTVALAREPSGKSEYFIPVLEDITERKRAEAERQRLEEQFLQSQKMEAVGRLAGGIAHDFNNLLTAITGYAELMLAHLNPWDPLFNNAIEIKKAGESAAALTRQLLAFSRKQVLQPKALDLNALLANLDRILRRVIGEDVDLVTCLAPDLWSVRIDPGQMEQVVMNLAVNSRDAMPRGGKLVIETANVLLDDAHSRKHVLENPGPYVMIAVSDTGCGMDEETRSRIFEPFFTTKDQEKGTGLGLSTVHGIVKQSGGHIWVYSEAGRGTTFKIFLPRFEGPAEPIASANDLSACMGAGETILLVEDSITVRKMIREILSGGGYKVLEARNAGEGLLFIERHEGPIHMMVTDVVMPLMGGPELAARAGALKPEMKVLYMSGYTENAVVHQRVLDEGIHFIEKPFSPEGLLRKIHTVLGRAGKG
ncbi:MAG: PAS domain S-box protein [Deltaproteobacteria bacterium]|nr:PAS domain S-box protein [Deltaproteobacteria bacterium]